MRPKAWSQFGSDLTAIPVSSETACIFSKADRVAAGFYQDVYAPLHRCDGVWSMRGNRRGNDENIQFDLLEHSLDIVEIGSIRILVRSAPRRGSRVASLLGPLVGDGDGSTAPAYPVARGRANARAQRCR